MASSAFDYNDRYVSYSPVASAGPFNVDFRMFDITGDDLEVRLDGAIVTNWSVAAYTAMGADDPGQWTGVQITFDAPITGTLEIAGKRLPRRASQFQTGRGIPPVQHNKALNELAAVQMELDRRFNDLGEAVAGAGTVVDSHFAQFDGVSGVRLKGGIALDADGGLTANSDTRVATQKAVKAYVDGIKGLQDAMVFKGVIDCSANPNYPAADRGWTYRVSVAGKIGGASGTNVEAGDLLICLTDGTASGNQATVGSAWTVTQANLDGAVIGPASAVDGYIPQFDGPTGKLLKGGKAAPAGALVGTSDTQTLSNKTLVNPTVDSVNSIAPIVILATGQSNFARNDAYSWTPPSNLAVWNWNGTTATLGTAFAALDGTTASAPYSFAAKVAEAHPTRKVYLLRIAIGAQPIAQWKTGAASPDVYADCKANVEAALTLLGLSKIDTLLWWQGEADTTSPATYITDFETVMTRFRGETWFPYTTPIVVFGLTPEASGAVAGFDIFNTYLQRCVYADPANRLFAYPGWATSTYWADNRHATGLGAHLIGIAAAQQFMGRAGARPMQGMYRNHGTGEQINRNVAVVTANVSDPTVPLVNTIARDIAADGNGAGRRSFEGYGGGFIATFVRAEGTAAAKSAITSGLALGNFNFGGWDGSAWGVTAAVRAASTENWNGTSRGTEVGFWTTGPGSTTLTQRWKVSDAGHLLTFLDNTYNLGSASSRVKELFAGTSTVNTSDATEKDWRGELDETEMRVAARLTQLIGVYRWKASVAEKGDAARLHVGVTVQAVVEAFKAEGLDPWRYAMCCSDTFDVLVDSGEKDEDGQPIMVATGEKQTRLGLRYDQLYAFVTAAALHQMQTIGDRLSALEAR